MPGSWEITQVRQNRILIGILMPPDGAVTLDYAQAIRGLQVPPGSDFMRVIGLPWGPARNQAAKTALDNGFHLAFLDSDVRVEPDAFMKLLATGLDIVSGLYYQRFFPYQPVAFNPSQDQQGNIIRVPVTGWNPGDIFPATFIPSGLTIYRRRLLAALFSRFERIFEWGVDVKPIPMEGGGQVPPFSEDFVLSWRALQLGFQPFVHSGVVGLHEVRGVVGPRWKLPLPDPNPLYGVCGVA